MNPSDIPPSPLKMTPGSILVQEFERKQTSKLHLPDTVKAKQEWGMKEFLVVSVGEARMLDNGGLKPMPVKVGDKVMPLFNQCVHFDIAGRHYLAMPMEAVIGIEDTTAITFLESSPLHASLLTKGAIAG